MKTVGGVIFLVKCYIVTYRRTATTDDDDDDDDGQSRIGKTHVS